MKFISLSIYICIYIYIYMGTQNNRVIVLGKQWNNRPIVLENTYCSHLLIPLYEVILGKKVDPMMVLKYHTHTHNKDV